MMLLQKKKKGTPFLLILIFLFSCEIKEESLVQKEQKESFQLLSTNLNQQQTLKIGESLVLEFDKEPDVLLFSKYFLIEPSLAGNWYFESKTVSFTPITPVTTTKGFTLHLTEKILSMDQLPLKETVLHFKIQPETIAQTTSLDIESKKISLKNQEEAIIQLSKPPHQFELYFTMLPIEATFLLYLTSSSFLEIDTVDCQEKKLSITLPQIESYQQEQRELVLSLNPGWMGENLLISNQKWRITIRWDKKLESPFALKKLFLLENPNEIQKGFIEIRNNQFTQEWVQYYASNNQSYLLFLFQTPNGSEVELFSLINSFNAFGENNTFHIQKNEWLSENAIVQTLPDFPFPPLPQKVEGEENNHYQWIALKANMIFPEKQYGMIRFSFSSSLTNSFHQKDKPKTILLIRYDQ